MHSAVGGHRVRTDADIQFTFFFANGEMQVGAGLYVTTIDGDGNLALSAASEASEFSAASAAVGVPAYARQ